MSLKSALAAVGLGTVACATSFVPAASQPVAAANEPRPNIVVMYLDDVNPIHRRLWCTQRTPNLARFCQKGVEFKNAYGTTPVCGPARASLLTGQYGHNHGVTDNSGAAFSRFDPSSTVAARMQGAGYHTIFAGKPINGIGLVTEGPEVKRYAQGWDDFGIIWRRKNQYKSFYKYNWKTRYSTSWKGTTRNDHSTRVVGNRVARQIRNAPRNKPVFAVASVYSGHTPNIAFPEHVGSSRCAGIKPWSGGAYNERNVSDKPSYIRAQPLLKARAQSLRTRCEEMLSVDKVVGQIRRALQSDARYYDTLFVLMSDNGVLLGDHRKPAGKRWPHATPIPLYMMWLKELGTSKRVVREPVLGIDLAPTFCRLAGCALDDPDGQSILSLLRGTADRLSRKYVFMEHLHPNDGMPPWTGFVTTRSYATGVRWQFVEYDNGERELYNLVNDPRRLKNLAGKPAQQDRVARFSTVLENQFMRPEGIGFLPASTFEVD
ncbi:MAG: sulfatase-like hydrolase/transferase [Candidatus Limnocylindrales bacterium]